MTRGLVIGLSLTGVAVVILLLKAGLLLADPRVVVPTTGGAGMTSTDMTPINITLHEYTDSAKWITTGRSVSFAIPEAFIEITSNLSGGAQFALNIGYDVDTGQPASLWRTDEKAGANLSPSERFQEERRKRVSITLKVRRNGSVVRPMPEFTLAEILAGKSPAYSTALRLPPRRLDDEYFGFDQFDGEKNPAFYQNQRAPFERASYFARRNADGKYDTFVACVLSRHNYPYCKSNIRFDGMWDMQVGFSGQYLSSYDKLIDQARKVLTEHLVAKTPPR